MLFCSEQKLFKRANTDLAHKVMVYLRYISNKTKLCHYYLVRLAGFAFHGAERTQDALIIVTIMSTCTFVSDVDIVVKGFR